MAKSFSPLYVSGGKLKYKTGDGLQFPSLTVDPVALGAGDAGFQWYRSDLNQFRYWDGVATVIFEASAGGDTMQTSYDGGPDILTSGNVPFQLRDNGIALGASTLYGPNYIDIATDTLGFIQISNSQGLPGFALGQQIILDTAVTFPAADQIEFGVDLRVQAGAVLNVASSVGAGSNIIDANIVNLKLTDISPTDEDQYIIVGFANGITTNSIAIVQFNSGLSPTFTATTGTAKIFKQTAGFNGSEGAGGGKNIFLDVAGGDGTAPLVATYNDGGNWDTMQALFNIGDLSSSMLNLINACPVFGAAADVPYINMVQFGVAPDAPDVIWSTKTADPTTPQANSMWTRADINRVKFRTQAGVSETLAYLSDVTGGSTLQAAYDASPDPATITLTNTKELVFNSAASAPVDIQAQGNTVLRVIGNGSDNCQITGQATAPSLELTNSTGSAPALGFVGAAADPTNTPFGGVWYNTSLDRLRFRTTTASETLAFESDVNWNTSMHNGNVFTIANGEGLTATINNNDTINNPVSFQINDTTSGGFLYTDGTDTFWSMTVNGLVFNPDSGNIGGGADLQVNSDSISDFFVVNASATPSVNIANTTGATGSLASFTPGTGVVFNDIGATDVDVRMESDTNANMFFLDASANTISMGATTLSSLDLSGASDQRVLFTNGTTVAQDALFTFEDTTNVLKVGTSSAAPNGGTILGKIIAAEGTIGTPHLGSTTLQYATGLELATIEAFKSDGLGNTYPDFNLDLTEASGVTSQRILNVDNTIGEIVINQSSHDLNFRIESATNPNFFVIDAGAETLAIAGTTAVDAILD